MHEDDFPKTYTPQDFEKRIYQTWLKNDAFQPDPQNDAKPFVMVIPPPNVTGVLHIGHGLNNTLQDLLARFYRMNGRPTLWVPGTDHAGISTQHVVEKSLHAQGLSRHDLGRDKFVDKTWEMARKHHDIIAHQLKEIGCSCDWSRERFTLDEGLSQAVRHVFVTLYQRDLIYQGEYLVNWCTQCGTALADDEVDYKDEPSFLYSIRYILEDGSGELVVATTRPETLFGDVAVAVHPEDPRYQAFIGKKVRLPLQDKLIPIIADTYVDRAFGTACLKITPAHDLNDYEIGKRHNLPCINILDPDGCLNQAVPEPWRGLTMQQARTQVVQALEERGLLQKKTPYTHRVGCCYRCQTPIEPYLSKQWFVRMRPLADKALAAWQNGQIKFYPKRWENTYRHWLENIRDWCISRQLWWGHRIPVWTCAQCGKIIVTEEDPHTCPDCGATSLIQDPDVLDTWFSSWLWPFSTLGWPKQTPDLARYYPTSTLVTAYDIIFFWVARMIMAGLEFTGQAPFTDIYITPLVRDKQGRKMSKSLGNGIDPLEIVQEYGADALKFTIVYLSSQTEDLPLDKESFKFGSKFCNKIWNASRYLLMNIGKIPVQKNVTLHTIDHWILSRLNTAAALVAKACKEYRFDDMAHAVYDYFWNDFCDWYIEASKLGLYNANPEEQSRAFTAALFIMKETLTLLHPFVPFITEELYAKIPGCAPSLLIRSAYPRYTKERDRSDLEAQFAAVQQLISGLRTLRSEQHIAPEKKVKVQLHIADTCPYRDTIRQFLPLVASLVRTESLLEQDTPTAPAQSLSYQGEGFCAYILKTDVLDKDVERQKTLKEIEKMEALLRSAEAKLTNNAFLAKAKPIAIEKEQAKKAEAEAALSKLQAYLKTLS